MISEAGRSLKRSTHGTGKAGELDTEVHDLDTPELQAVREVQDRAPISGSESVAGAEVGLLSTGRCDPGRRDLAADDALAVIRLETVDAHGRRWATGSRSAAGGR